MQYLQAHLRNVAAFVIREIATKYGKSPGGYVWALLEPVAFIAMMSVLFGATGRLPMLGTSFPLFYATGYLAFHMFKSMEPYLTGAIKSNKTLMLYPRVAPIDIVVARFLLQSLTSVVVAIVILYVIGQTLRHPVAIGWYSILESIAFAWCLAIGVSFINIVLFFHFPLYEKVYGVITRPLFILSGVFYLPQHIPQPYQEILLWNPLTHVVMLFREGFYGARASGADRMFLLEISIVLLALGFVLFTCVPVARARER